MKTLRRLAILIFGTRWLCFHDLCVIRYNDGHMWTMCLKCGHESDGVQIRGPEVAS